MNQVDILTRQTADAYEWTNKLVNSIPLDKWDQTPEVIESNISWQDRSCPAAGSAVPVAGEVALKRIIDERFEFGLQRNR